MNGKKLPFLSHLSKRGGNKIAKIGFFEGKRSIHFSLKATSFLLEVFAQWGGCRLYVLQRQLTSRASHQFAGKREQKKSVWSPTGSWDPQKAWQHSMGGESCSWGGYPQLHCPPHGCSPGCCSHRQPAAIPTRWLQQQCWRYGGSHVPWACYRSRLNSFSYFIRRIGWALWKFNPACIFLVYVLVYYKMPWNLTQMLPLHKNYHSSFRMGKIQPFSIFTA